MLGINHAASLASVSALLLIPSLPVIMLPLLAFAGGMAGLFLLRLLAETHRPMKLALSACWASLTDYLMLSHPQDVNSALMWLTGSLWGRDWHVVYIAVPLTELSGGQRQRAFLAMVLVQDTPVVLLDEPTTYFDINHQVELMYLMHELQPLGKTVVAVLHDLNQASRYCDHLVMMATGFSEIANILGSEPGTIFTMLRDTGGIKPNEHKRAVAHLTLSEREEIRAGLSAKMSIRAIASALNRSPSTISREVQRNRGRRYYKAVDANNRANRMARRPKPCIYRCENLFWKSWR